MIIEYTYLSIALKVTAPDPIERSLEISRCVVDDSDMSFV